jgi:hypothetical protein
MSKEEKFVFPLSQTRSFSSNPYMDPVGKRDHKRQSAKKSSERSIYTQKAVRAKEALTAKKLTTSINK